MTYKKRKIIILSLVLTVSMIFSACEFIIDMDTSDTYSETSRSSELSEPGDSANSEQSSEDSSDNTSSVVSNSTSETSSVTSSETSSEYSQDEVSYDENTVQIINGIIVAGTRGMEQYGGGPKSAAAYAGYLNDFKVALGDGINVYSMPIPIASAFYAPEQYKSSINAHINTFASVRDNLVGVKDVNLLNALSLHTDEKLYSYTDYHWQALGAYYSSQELAKVAGVSFTDISNFTRESFSGYLGSLSSKSSILKNNPEEFVYYVPNQEYTANFYKRTTFKDPFENSLFFAGNSYSKFIGGDSYCVKVDTGVNNGRKLIIFKESYGNALVPFLIGSFEQVYVVDIRYFEFDVLDFIKENGITDVCFSLSAFSIVGSNGAKVKNMN
ncbi:MAG: hypothetical protein A2Y15_06635 [Clostridiales bacterium GWF2_36_10]|nr:MAG: hypothetical protein A2Y15_06635 [Clostridiales bacterium GWF2_36_10]